MPRTQTDYTQIEYNGRRLKYIVPAALAVNGYYFVFLYYVHKYDFISRVDPGLFTPGLFPRADATGPFFIQLVIFILLLFVAFSGLAYFRVLGAKGSFAMLTSATILFLLTICLPIYFWGGSHKSLYGPLLAAVSALTVIVAQTDKVRSIFGLACVVAFTFLSLPDPVFLPESLAYRQIVINKGSIGNGFQFTGVGFYEFLQAVASIGTIMIAIALSWIHGKDKKSIFGDEEGKIHVLDRPASRREKNDMLQTSIKIAIDIDAGVLAGGGVSYPECVTNLRKHFANNALTFQEEHVWCAEWAPVAEEIVRESMIPLANPGTDIDKIYETSNQIAKRILGKKQGHVGVFR
jgi:hypothetical protein